MFFVKAKWYARNKGVGDGIRYISHREERLPEGRTRDLFGIGERYRGLRGDEAAITQLLWKDGEGLGAPRYFRVQLTVDDVVARGLSSLPTQIRERVMRDAVDRTFRGSFRTAQGVFVIHEHGGRGRPFGHPHIHAHLSPLLADGRPMRRIPPARLQAFKKRWGLEVTTGLERALGRQDRPRTAPDRDAGRTLEKARGARTTPPGPAQGKQVLRGLQILERWRARGPLREASPLADATLRAHRRISRAAQNPSRFAGAEGLRALIRSLPGPARTVIQLTRMLGRIIR